MNRNPIELLELAYEQFKNSEYEDALKNYQWFFNNAVDIDSTFSGAKYRMLKEWYCLAKEYKPAYDALVEQKSKSLSIFNDKHDVESLSEYAEICYILSMDKEFIELFSRLCINDLDLAKLLFPSVEKILIDNSEWELCNLCIDDSIQNYQSILERFDELISISNNAFNGKHNTIYERQLEKDIQNLFWILKVGDREDEINLILAVAKEDLRKRRITQA